MLLCIMANLLKNTIGNCEWRIKDDFYSKAMKISKLIFRSDSGEKNVHN